MVFIPESAGRKAGAAALRAAGVRLPSCPFLLYMANPLSERTNAAVWAAAYASGEAEEHGEQRGMYGIFSLRGG